MIKTASSQEFEKKLRIRRSLGQELMSVSEKKNLCNSPVGSNSKSSDVFASDILVPRLCKRNRAVRITASEVKHVRRRNSTAPLTFRWHFSLMVHVPRFCEMHETCTRKWYRLLQGAHIGRRNVIQWNVRLSDVDNSTKTQFSRETEETAGEYKIKAPGGK